MSFDLGRAGHCLLATAAIGAASCSGGATAKPRTPGTVSKADISNPALANGTAADARSDAERDAEQLAAVEFAMNQLDEGSQLCWAAAAAVDGFEIAGGLKFHIDIAAKKSVATVLEDDIKNLRLRDCMVTLLSAYRWAPPLDGQAVELPFVFRAPVRQSVIDRRLVPWLASGAASTTPAMAVLLDAQNTGNSDASLLEVVMPAGVSTGDRVVVRPELWYFFTTATIALAGQVMQVAVGDVVWLPSNTVRNIGGSSVSSSGSSRSEVRALLLLAPGGIEGSARSGALPTPLASVPLAPVRSRQATSSPKGVASVPVATKFAAAATVTWPMPQGSATVVAMGRNLPASVTLLELAAGTTLAAHHHDDATEVMYVLGGSASLTVDGVTLQIGANSVVQFPKGISHSATITQALRALVFYTPAGPEQRFKTTVTTP